MMAPFNTGYINQSPIPITGRRRQPTAPITEHYGEQSEPSGASPKSEHFSPLSALRSPLRAAPAASAMPYAPCSMPASVSEQRRHQPPFFLPNTEYRTPRQRSCRPASVSEHFSPLSAASCDSSEPMPYALCSMRVSVSEHNNECTTE